MASQHTMSGQNKELSSQTLALTVILTRHIKLDSVAKNIVQKNKLLHYEYTIIKCKYHVKLTGQSIQ